MALVVQGPILGMRGGTARQSKADGQQGTGGHLVDGGHNLEQLVIRHVLEGEGALC